MSESGSVSEADSISELSEQLYERDRICTYCRTPLTTWDVCPQCKEYREDSDEYYYGETIMETYHNDYNALLAGENIDTRNMEAAQEMIEASVVRAAERTPIVKRNRLHVRFGSHNIWRLGKNVSQKHGPRNTNLLIAATQGVHIVLIQEISNPDGDETQEYVKAVQQANSNLEFVATEHSTRKKQNSTQRDHFGFLFDKEKFYIVDGPEFIDDALVANDTFSYVPAFLYLSPLSKTFNDLQFNFISVHLTAAKSAHNKRVAEMKAIGEWIADHCDNVCWIVGGDFNVQDSPGSAGAQTQELLAALCDASRLQFTSQNPGLATNLPRTNERKQYDHFFIAQPDNYDIDWSFAPFNVIDTSNHALGFYANRSTTSDHIAIRSGSSAHRAEQTTADTSTTYLERQFRRHLSASNRAYFGDDDDNNVDVDDDDDDDEYDSDNDDNHKISKQRTTKPSKLNDKVKQKNKSAKKSKKSKETVKAVKKSSTNKNTKKTTSKK